MVNQSKYFNFFNPERYKQSFFKSEAIQEAIKEDGYCVVDLLSSGEISLLRNGYEEIKTAVKGDFGALFWPSGRSEDPKIRNLAKNHIDNVLPKKMEALFQEDTYEFIGGTYLIKPPSENSALNPHQDSAHTNEFEQFSVYAWIPLEDVNEMNGAMKVLPKSHQINIKQRSLNVPWILEPYLEILRPHMKTVNMKAGQVLLFDAALIHSSPPNLSKNTRVAVNFYVHPKGHPFTHYYRDVQTPTGEVEAYSVRPDFYYSENFESKPNKSYQKLENQKLLIPFISGKEVAQICQELKGQNLITRILNFLNPFS